MEDFINSLPKPLLAFLAIAIALVVFALNDPPGTICDVQKSNFTDDLKGKIFPQELNKKKYPPSIPEAQKACQDGNSAGSCLEYFGILKAIAKGVLRSRSECRADLIGISEVRSALEIGTLLMAKMAWGEHPPEPDSSRFGWFQESELALFCQIKDAYSQGLGDEAWEGLRHQIIQEFPGEKPKDPRTGNVLGDAPKAITVFNDRDMWNRSVFSVRCDNFR